MPTCESSTDHVADGILSLRKELQQLEDEYDEEMDRHSKRIRQLREKRAALSQTLNNCQESTKELPTEVMSLIFRGACASSSGPAVALPIAHVSVRWRQIAWLTPHLWTRMVTDVSLRALPSIFSLLRLHLDNAKYLCLSLQLLFSGHQELAGLLGALLKLLSDRENTQKIRSLALKGVPNHLSPLPSNGHLSRPCVNSTTRQPVSFPPIDLSHQANLLAAEPSFPMITSLDLCFMPMNTCIELLLRCPNIVSISVTSLLDNADDPETGWDWPPSPEIVKFHHLEQITWVFNHSPISMSLFRRIRAPRLQSLCCEYNSRGKIPPKENLWLFANSFPRTLTQLKLCSLGSWPSGFFRRVFARTVHLESLTLDSFPKSIVNNIVSILHRKQESEVSYLPSLKALTIGMTKDSTLIIEGNTDEFKEVSLLEYDKEFGGRILRLLERQWQSGVDRFTLTMEFRPKWLREVQRRILMLVEAGFDLEIEEDGTKPAWLHVGV